MVSVGRSPMLGSSLRIAVMMIWAAQLVLLLQNVDAFQPELRAFTPVSRRWQPIAHSRVLVFSPISPCIQVAHLPPKLMTASASEIAGDDDDNDISIAGPTFGVIKAMVGSGMLALPAGLAAVTNYPSGLWPAHMLLVSLGIISAYTFLLYGRLTHATQAKSLGEIWKKVYVPTTTTKSTTESSKRDSSLVVSLASFVFCFGACLTCSLIFGDMFSSFLQGSRLALPAWAMTRQASILAITTAIVFPLCNLSSLAALAPVSVVGVIGTIISTAFLALRCPAVVPSSPYAVAGQDMLAQVALQPSFSTYSRVMSPAPLILIAMSCVSLMAHFSAPEFYLALTAKKHNDDKSPDDKVLRRFTKMTIAGYTSVAVLNSLALAFGFLTFGGNCEGIILNNYSNSDWGANLSRLLVGVSVIGSYPFLMGASRLAALELFETGKEVTRAREFRMTTILLSIATAISLVVKDAGFVVSFNGALMGSSIIYIIPSLLFLKLTANRLSNGTKLTKLLRAERWLCRSLVGFGVVSAIVGGVTTVVSSFFPHLLR
jgi:solute carrier family 38 (sodium-coupled neutral amino acid transporter), member 11